MKLIIALAFVFTGKLFAVNNCKLQFSFNSVKDKLKEISAVPGDKLQFNSYDINTRRLLAPKYGIIKEIKNNSVLVLLQSHLDEFDNLTPAKIVELGPLDLNEILIVAKPDAVISNIFDSLSLENKIKLHKIKPGDMIQFNKIDPISLVYFEATVGRVIEIRNTENYGTELVLMTEPHMTPLGTFSHRYENNVITDDNPHKIVVLFHNLVN